MNLILNMKENPMHFTNRLSTLLKYKCTKYENRYKTKVKYIFLVAVQGINPPFKYGQIYNTVNTVRLSDSFPSSTLSNISDFIVVESNDEIILSLVYLGRKVIYQMYIVSESMAVKLEGKGLGYSEGVIPKLPKVKVQNKDVVLDYGQIYRSCNLLVMNQNKLDYNIIEYSFDNGQNWKDAPSSIRDKIFEKAWFRLKAV